MDLCSGFWQVQMHPKDIPKTTFTTKYGNYAYKVMPFGLMNAPATFQRLMNKVLRGLLGKSVLVYIDDVIVYSRDLESHRTHLREVLDRLSQAGLRLKRSKCLFGHESVRFLGHVVGAAGVSTDEGKIEAVRDAKPPENRREVRSFINFAGYYRRFVEGFAKIARPLSALTSEKAPFVWGPTEQQSFDELKSCLISAPILAHPDFQKDFILYTDASMRAVGAVLAQKDEQGRERVIQYLSRKMSDAETRYTTSEQECLAIIFALRKLRHYLLGRKFTLYTDHEALKYLLATPNLKGKLARWYIEINEFRFDVQHRPGVDNPVADYLSRPSIGEGEDGIELTVSSVVVDTVDFWETARSLLEDTTNRYLAGPKGALRKKLLRRFTLGLDGKLLKRRKGESVEVIQEVTRRKELVRTAHERYGHCGVNGLFYLLRGRCWWPRLYDDVQEFVKTCVACQKLSNGPKAEPPGKSEWRPKLFESISMDWITALPESRQGNTCLLVAVDEYSRFMWAQPASESTAKEVHRFLMGLFGLIGIPRYLKTDNAACFKGGLITGLLRNLGIRRREIPPYHPASNGIVERANGTLQLALSKKLCEVPDLDWEEALPMVLLGVRTRRHSTLKASPFKLVFGREPELGLEEATMATDVYVDLTDADAREEDLVSTWQNHGKNTFQPGDLVLTRTTVKEKLGTRWEGPFVIHEVVGPKTYRIRHPHTGQVVRMVHVRQLKSYRERVEDDSHSIKGV
jgi:transposase InsO family protein